MTDFLENVHELLKCPVCFTAMDPPIHQCSNGHTICDNCKPRVRNQCPICRLELGNIRCLALEKMAVSLERPCKYQSLGCVGIYPYYIKLTHQSECAFRPKPYNCPYVTSECTFMGDIPDLVTHLKDDHQVHMHEGSTFTQYYWISFIYKAENTTQIFSVYNYSGHFFCLHFFACKLGTTPVYIAYLRCMGEDHEANNYRYSLEVEGYGRKLRWEGVPRSIKDNRNARGSLMGSLFIKIWLFSFQVVTVRKR